MQFFAMIKRLFFRHRHIPLPDPVPPEKINGIWEAPGFDATFTCMKCGCNQGCNNVTNCYRCRLSHFAISAVHMGKYVFYMKPPPPNCIMARDAIILVPTKDGFDRYEAGPNGHPVKTQDRCGVVGYPK